MQNNISQNIYSNVDLIEVGELEDVLRRSSGIGKKSVFVLFRAGEAENLTDVFAEKILSAVNLDKKTDTKWISLTESDSFSLMPMCRRERIRIVLSFGISPSQVGIAHQIKHNEPLKIGEVSLLFTHSLELIENDKSKKSALWHALKALFEKHS